MLFSNGKELRRCKPERVVTSCYAGMVTISLFFLLTVSTTTGCAMATAIQHRMQEELSIAAEPDRSAGTARGDNGDGSDKEFSLREFYSIKRALMKGPDSTRRADIKTSNSKTSSLRRAQAATAALEKFQPRNLKFYGQDHYEQTKTDVAGEVTWTHVGRPDEFAYHLFFRTPLLLNGTFIETGAGNGVRDSNTLFFEKQLGWSGLLVEGSTENFLELFADGRRKRAVKTYAAVCERRGMTKFVGDGQAAGAVEDMTRHHVESWGRHFKSLEVYDVPCERMDRIVERASLPRVIDFWSIDIEGGEWRALHTFDWRQYRVRVVLVEMGISCFLEKRNRCAALLRDQGFCRVAKRAVNEFWTSDPSFKAAYCGIH